MHDDATSLDDDVELALSLADEASALALDHFRHGVGSTRKPDGSIVTDADLAVERHIVATLTSRRPLDGILGEELGAVAKGRRRWIIDPIDGTRNFVAGRADWGVHLALETDGEIVVGVVTRPVRQHRWWARRGGGAYVGQLGHSLPTRRLRVSQRASMLGARVSGWFADDDPVGHRFRTSDSWFEPLDLDVILRVADGELDVLFDGTTVSEIWDRAPFTILVEEAGGGHRPLRGGLFTNGSIDKALRTALLF